MTVEVWSVDLVPATPGLLALDAEFGLSAGPDRQAARRLRDTAAGDQRLAMRVAVRLLIERLTGKRLRAQPFSISPAGKPTLDDAGCHFSLSHVAGRGLIALADAPVGIDLEARRIAAIDSRRRGLIEAASETLSPHCPLPEGDPERRFLQAWTRLEALAKADGCGIGHLLGDIGAMGPGRRVSGTAAATSGSSRLQRLNQDYGVQDLALDRDHVGALAAGTGAPLLRNIESLPHDLTTLRQLLAPPASTDAIS